MTTKQAIKLYTVQALWNDVCRERIAIAIEAGDTETATFLREMLF